MPIESLLTQDDVNQSIFGTDLILTSRKSMLAYLKFYEDPERMKYLWPLRNKWLLKSDYNKTPFLDYEEKLLFLDILISSYIKSEKKLSKKELKKLKKNKRLKFEKYSIPLRNNGFVPVPVHGLQVSQILSHYEKFDNETKIAALFHDLFEDTKKTKSILEKTIKKKLDSLNKSREGKNKKIKNYNLEKIVNLIESVSLKGRSEYHSCISNFIKSDYAHETYAIKFADRIHNTQTFSADEPPLYTLINGKKLKDKVLINGQKFNDLFDKEIRLEDCEKALKEKESKQPFFPNFFEDRFEKIKETNYKAHLALKETGISFSNLKGDFVLSNTYKNIILINSYRSNRKELSKRNNNLRGELDKLEKQLLDSCMAELDQHINHLLTFHVSHKGENKAFDVIKTVNKHYKDKRYNSINGEKTKDYTNYDMNIREALEIKPENFLQNFIDPLLKGKNRDALKARFEKDRKESNKCLYELLFYMNMRNTIKTYDNNKGHFYKNLGAKGITK
jgi:hypothetical protein